jgi:hypothetical protein
MKMLNDYQYVSAKKAIQSLTEVYLQTGDKYFQTKRDEIENYLEVTDIPQYGGGLMANVSTPAMTQGR